MSCQQELMTLGKPYPRTCEDCGLGPCKNNTAKANRWFDCTDEQLIEEVRRRGFVIRDAQVGPKWVGLTDKDYDELLKGDWGGSLIAAVESKLKERNK